MIVIRFGVLLFSSFLVSASVFAHAPERTVDPVSRHGGLAKRMGEYNLELVVGPNQIVVYVHSQNNRPLSTEAAVASILVMHDAGSKTIELLPAGENRLAAEWQAPAVEEIRAVLSLALYGKKPIRRLVLSIPVLVRVEGHINLLMLQMEDSG